ncbi:MAG: response regulator transcription factor [Gammaproteobacteria bacterium]
MRNVRLSTWLNVGETTIMRVFLQDLSLNNRLTALATHAPLSNLDRLPDALILQHPILVKTLYVRAINSGMSHYIERNRTRWEAYTHLTHEPAAHADASNTAAAETSSYEQQQPEKQEIAETQTLEAPGAETSHITAPSKTAPSKVPASSPIASPTIDTEQHLIETIHRALSTPAIPDGAAQAPTMSLPSWIETNSRLILAHTIAQLEHKPPTQTVLAQLEKIAIKAAHEHDADTLLHALKHLKLLTLRFGYIDHYLKANRYLTDWVKQHDHSDPTLSEKLMIIQGPYLRLSERPRSQDRFNELTDYAFHFSQPDAGLLYCHNLNHALHHAWAEQWPNALGFLERTALYFQEITEPLRQYLINPSLLRHLIELSLSADDTTNPAANQALDTRHDEAHSVYDTPFLHLIDGLIHFQHESFISTETSFEQATLSATQLNSETDLMFCSILCARFYLHRHNEQRALDAFKQALDYLDNGGLLFPFRLLGHTLKPLLELANQHRIAQAEHITRCRRAFPILFQDDNETPTINALLSKREFEILQYMSEGKSNDEISKLLHRSIGTVKLHAHNIYKKLKVKNRVEAINLYKQSELMEGDAC